MTARFRDGWTVPRIMPALKVEFGSPSISKFIRIVACKSWPASATPRGPCSPNLTSLTITPSVSRMLSIRVRGASGSGSISSRISRASEYPLCQGEEVVHAGISDTSSDRPAESSSFVRALKYSTNNTAAASPDIFGDKSPNIATSGDKLPHHDLSASESGRFSFSRAAINFPVNAFGSGLESRYQDRAVIPAGLWRISPQRARSSSTHVAEFDACRSRNHSTAEKREVATASTETRATPSSTINVASYAPG